LAALFNVHAETVECVESSAGNAWYGASAKTLKIHFSWRLGGSSLQKSISAGD
jgi:hypothetical protein